VCIFRWKREWKERPILQRQLQIHLTHCLLLWNRNLPRSQRGGSQDGRSRRLVHVCVVLCCASCSLLAVVAEARPNCMRPLLDDLYFYDEVVRIGWCDPVAASAADRGRSPIPPGITSPHDLRAKQSGMLTQLLQFSLITCPHCICCRSVNSHVGCPLWHCSVSVINYIVTCLDCDCYPISSSQDHHSINLRVQIMKILIIQFAPCCQVEVPSACLDTICCVPL
jgi:hypothetical protein